MIQTLAFSEHVDTGDLDLEVTRDAGSDLLSIGASIFCATIHMRELLLVSTAIDSLVRGSPMKDEMRVVVLDNGNEVGFGLSQDRRSLWINCAPFHLRVSAATADELVKVLVRAHALWLQEGSAPRALRHVQC